MKRFFSLCILSIFMLTFAGCSQLVRSRTEIDRIFNTRIVAIDSTDDNKILYTIVTKTAMTDTAGQGGGSAASDVLVSNGATVFEAARKMGEYAHRKPHYGHTEFIIFGEDTAREGILPYLDFISRNQEFRYNAKIYIIQGHTANDFITKVNEAKIFLADRLSLMEDNSYAISISDKVTLAEALFIFGKENIATFLPVIAIAPSKPGELPSQGPYDMAMKGYAIFKEDKLVEFLDEDMSRGVNWVKNRMRSAVILVDAPDKKKVSLEIAQSKTTIKPFIDENGLQCTISINFSTNLSETMSEEELFTIESFDYLKKQQEKQVKQNVEKVIRYALEKDMDIFGLLSPFIIKYPMMKDELREKWRELFPEIKFNVEVDSKINRTYLITESVNTK